MFQFQFYIASLFLVLPANSLYSSVYTDYNSNPPTLDAMKLSLGGNDNDIYVTGFGKMCIVHTSNFEYLEIHKTTVNSTQVFREDRGPLVVLQSLKVSYI